MRIPAFLPLSLTLLLFAACSSPPPRQASTPDPGSIQPAFITHAKGNEVALYALGLIDTGYRFGGKNPDAGLDCSGMVSFVYNQAAGLKIRGSAAEIANKSRSIERTALRPGDLVFFNTRNQSFSHVGIYIGDARFIHAPSTNGRVRIDRLNDRYYAQRYEAARTLFD